MGRIRQVSGSGLYYSYEISVCPQAVRDEARVRTISSVLRLFHTSRLRLHSEKVTVNVNESQRLGVTLTVMNNITIPNWRQESGCVENH